VWRDGEPTIKAAAGTVYGRLYDPTLKRSDAAHRVVWRRVYGSIRLGMTVDHPCEVTLCQRPDHLELVPKPENTRGGTSVDKSEPPGQWFNADQVKPRALAPNPRCEHCGTDHSRDAGR
jgi:hypothetical protein